jgi:hypothetical protein
MTGTGFIWAGGLQKRGGDTERAAAIMMKLKWWLGFMFGRNWHGETRGRCTQVYIGVWEESERIKI